MLAFLSAVELIKATSDHESLHRTTATAVYVALAIKFGSYVSFCMLSYLFFKQKNPQIFYIYCR